MQTLSSQSRTFWKARGQAECGLTPRDPQFCSSSGSQWVSGEAGVWVLKGAGKGAGGGKQHTRTPLAFPFNFLHLGSLWGRVDRIGVQSLRFILGSTPLPPSSKCPGGPLLAPTHLLPLLDVEILPGVGAPHEHDLELLLVPVERPGQSWGGGARDSHSSLPVPLGLSGCWGAGGPHSWGAGSER